LCISTATDCYLILRIYIVFSGKPLSQQLNVDSLLTNVGSFFLSAAVGSCSMCSTKRLFRLYVTLRYS
jgi:amino acid permease